MPAHLVSFAYSLSVISLRFMFCNSYVGEPAQLEQKHSWAAKKINRPFAAKLTVAVARIDLGQTVTAQVPGMQAECTRRHPGPAPEGAAETAGIPVSEFSRYGLDRCLCMAEGFTGGPAAAAVYQFGVVEPLLLEQTLERTRTPVKHARDCIDVRVTLDHQGIDQSTDVIRESLRHIVTSASRSSSWICLRRKQSNCDVRLVRFTFQAAKQNAARATDDLR